MNTQTVAFDQAALPPLSRRDLRSVTAEAEKRILVSLARRLPGWIGPDHLTALGVASMAGAGLCYWLLPQSPLALLGVNLFLFLNWFGDSLDGTVARVRQRQRPRYGFYVDHLVDALGAIFLLVGLAFSSLGTKAAALALLVAYLLLQIHIALKAHATGVFQIAFAGVGGTEARLLLSAMNLGLLMWPGNPAAILAPLIWVLAAVLVVVVAFDGVRTGRALDREERLRWADGSCSRSHLSSARTRPRDSPVNRNAEGNRLQEQPPSARQAASPGGSPKMHLVHRVNQMAHCQASSKGSLCSHGLQESGWRSC